MASFHFIQLRFYYINRSIVELMELWKIERIDHLDRFIYLPNVRTGCILL